MEWHHHPIVFGRFRADLGVYADDAAAIQVGQREPMEISSRPTAEYQVSRKQPETGLTYYVRRQFDRSEGNVLKTEKQFLESRFRDFELYCSMDLQRESRVGVRMGDDV